MLNFVFDNLQILFYECLLLAYIILDISKMTANLVSVVCDRKFCLLI